MEASLTCRMENAERKQLKNNKHGMPVRANRVISITDRKCRRCHWLTRCPKARSQGLQLGSISPRAAAGRIARDARQKDLPALTSVHQLPWKRLGLLW